MSSPKLPDGPTVEEVVIDTVEEFLSTYWDDEGDGVGLEFKDRTDGGDPGPSRAVHDGEVGVTVVVGGVDYYVSARRMGAEPN